MKGMKEIQKEIYEELRCFFEKECVSQDFLENGFKPSFRWDNPHQETWVKKICQKTVYVFLHIEQKKIATVVIDGEFFT